MKEKGKRRTRESERFEVVAVVVAAFVATEKLRTPKKNANKLLYILYIWGVQSNIENMSNAYFFWDSIL